MMGISRPKPQWVQTEEATTSEVPGAPGKPCRIKCFRACE